MSSTQHPDLDRFAELEDRAGEGGGAQLQRRQKRLGRMLARERIAALVDEGSFQELGKLRRSDPEDPALGDGVVTGVGNIAGRPVAVYAHDATVLRGALGIGGARKIVRLLEHARRQRMPVVAIHDSDGVRVNEGPEAIAGFAEVLGRTAELSGWVPQVGVVLGLCVGGAAYSSALQDVVIGQRETGFLFVTGSKVAKITTGQDAPIEDIGGVEMHARTTGLVHLAADGELECLAHARAVLGYFPRSAAELVADLPCTDAADRETPAIAGVLPDSDRKGYDMRRILTEVVDAGSFLELQAAYAPSLVVGLARLAGRAIGIVASQPSYNAGCLDVDSSRKGARFVQLCSAYGLPVITFCDVPGFLPGKRQEQGGLLLHGAKLIAAYAACRTPRVSLIVRKSYGGGNVLAYPADVRLAYPFARVQPMGMDAARAVASHRTFGADDGSDPEDELRRRLGDRYDAMERAAEAGVVDAVIHPARTRIELVRALESLDRLPMRDLPPRAHPNIPM
jgi:propionyl-CoA carboxylase beta chain